MGVGQMSLEEFWSLEGKASKETNQSLLNPRGFTADSSSRDCLVTRNYLPFIPSLQDEGESYPNSKYLWGILLFLLLNILF